MSTQKSADVPGGPLPSAAKKIIDEMTELVPPGQAAVDFRSREELQRLTALLLETDSSGAVEYERYRAIQERSLDTTRQETQLRDAYAGRRVLVTGGTGCVGSELVRQLQRFEPAAVYVIYALHDEFEPVPGVVYLHVDVADAVPTAAAVADVRPDVIFHCAAQRSPWLAEREVRRTVRSNVLGTRNVLRAAREVAPERFVHASTGKAMRYYTTDVYAASKKLSEWLVADYAREGRQAGLARFTHVVDNAVLLERVDDALAQSGGVMRVHDPDACFYAQSARESAQLLLLAGLTGVDGAEGVAIRSLGDPAALLDVVIGHISVQTRPQRPAIYFSGSEKGYELRTPPGLYDPATAVEVSPLINAIEARTVQSFDGDEIVDRFCPASVVGEAAELDAAVEAVSGAAVNGSALDTATELARATRDLAEATFRSCPPDLFRRLHGLAEQANGSLPTTRRPLPDRLAS